VQKLFNVAALQNYSSSSNTYPAPQFSDIFHCAAQHYWIGLVQYGEGVLHFQPIKETAVSRIFSNLQMPHSHEEKTPLKFFHFTQIHFKRKTMLEENILNGLPLMNKRTTKF
jgi:hypothetical protein